MKVVPPSTCLPFIQQVFLLCHFLGAIYKVPCVVLLFFYLSYTFFLSFFPLCNGDRAGAAFESFIYLHFFSSSIKLMNLAAGECGFNFIYV